MAKQQSSNRFFHLFLETFGGPLLWGLITTFVYYFAVTHGILRHDLLVRYTAGHPVEYVEVGLFFVGLLAIARRGRQAVGQVLSVRNVEMPQAASGTLAHQVSSLLEQLAEFPHKVRQTLYAQRLTAALEHVQRHDSPHQLDDELKYLSDMDAERTHEGYALVRIIIWATPMLGFLGTVIGITLALGDLSPEALVNSPKDAMEGLLSGLSVAFDTTALALTLSIVLMFAQFLTQQIDALLLSTVDRRVTEDLTPYFCQDRVSRDPQVAAVQQMAQTVLTTMEASNRHQTETWQQAIDQAQQQWAHTLQDAGEAVRHSLAEALRDSLNDHTDNLIRLEEAAGQVASRHWQQWHLSSSETLRELQRQQTQLVRHGEILTQALQATGEVISLEKALNQNLRALAGAKNFEDTVMSLSAAIHLLSLRLSKPLPRDAHVRLEAASEERAA